MVTFDAIAWIAFALVIICVILFSLAFTKYFEDKRENELIVTICVVSSMVICLCTVALLPIDIALVSSTNDPSTGLRKSWADDNKVESIVSTLKTIYYIAYSLVVMFCFILIPWTYFYYEEFDENQTRKSRFLSATQYSGYTLLIAFILLIIGLFYRPHNKDDNTNIDLDWFKHLIGETSLEHAISFVIATLIALGTITSIIYTGPGMAVLPIGMIKGRYFASADDYESVMKELTINKEKQRTIEVKYTGSITPMSRRDRWTLNNLQKQERILTRRSRTIQEQRASTWTKFAKLMRPMQVFIGFIFLLLSIAITVSMFLTLIDKIRNSVCGKNCGYILSNPEIFNPINLFFTNLAQVFPLDYVFFLILIGYFFFCSICGIISVGIRFLWVHLYKVRRGSTTPQGLLVTCLLLMMSLLALNYTLSMVIAPSYLHFGNQRFCNYTIDGIRDCSLQPNAIIPCQPSAPSDVCISSVVSILLDRITYNNRFFGIIFYWSQWMIVGMFLLGLLFSILRSRKLDGFLAGNDDDSDDEELLLHDQEEQLLSGFRRRIGNVFEDVRDQVGFRGQRTFQ